MSSPRVALVLASLLVACSERAPAPREPGPPATRILATGSKPKGTRVAGTIRTISGLPLANARVEAKELAPDCLDRFVGPARSTRSDENGRFELGLDGQRYLLELAYPQRVTEHVLVDASTNDLTVGLSLAGSVAGTAVDADGKPVAEARVVARSEGAKRAVFAEATSDQTGHFVFNGLPPGVFMLTASAARLTSWQPTPVSLHEGQTVSSVSLVMRAGYSLAGVLHVDRTGNQPPPAISVGVAELRSGLSSSDLVEADENGRFEIAGLLPGEYQVLARVGDVELPLQVGTAHLVDADILDFKARVPATFAISGHVETRVGATVELRREVAVPHRRTESLAHVYVPAGETHFNISGVSAGSVSVTALTRDEKRAEQKLEISTSSPRKLRLVPRALGSIHGRTIDMAGAAISRVSVVVSSGMPKHGQLEQTGYFFGLFVGDSDGYFRVPALQSGLYSLEVFQKLHRLPWGKPPDPTDATAPLLVTVGEAQSGVYAELVTAGCPGVLRGTVLHPDTGPVAGAWVRVREAGREEGVPLPSAGSWQHALTDANGHFEFSRLCAPRYEVRASSSSGSLAAWIPGAGIGENVQLKLAPRTSITGRVVASDIPVALFSLEGVGEISRRHTLMSTDGRFELTNVDEGPYGLVIVAESGYVFRDLTAGAPMLDLGDLELQRWSRISGRLVETTGQPLAGAHVGINLHARQPFLGNSSVLQARHHNPDATTGPDGSFELAEVMPGDGWLLLHVPGERRVLCGATVRTSEDRVTDSSQAVAVSLGPEENLDLGMLRTCPVELPED